MKSAATTVSEYLASLPPERRQALSEVRAHIRKHLPAGLEEGMQYGMISWYVPLSRCPETYNGQPLSLFALASQKNAMSLYLMSVYARGDAAFRAAWKKTGKKLDMGKSCIRFRKVEDLALDVIGDAVSAATVEDMLRVYEQARKPSRRPAGKAARAASAAKKAKPPAARRRVAR